MGRPFREGEVRVHHHGDEDAEINSKQLDSLTRLLDHALVSGEALYFVRMKTLCYYYVIFC